MSEPPALAMPDVPGVAVEHRHVALPDGTRLHVAEAGAARRSTPVRAGRGR